MYDSTLLPQTNEPIEIQKAILDLLAKINELSGSSGQSSTSVTVERNYTLAGSINTVMVNTNDAITISVPAKAAIGTKFEINRIASGLTTNAITVQFTGETIYGASTVAIFGAAVAKTAKALEVWIFEKKTATTWELIDGTDSGSNANGSYRKFSDGTMDQWGRKTTSAITSSNLNAFGSTSGQSYYNAESDIVTFPVAFYDTTYSVSVASIYTTTYNTGDRTTSVLGRVYVIKTASGGTAVVDWTATGRWGA